MKRRPCFQWRRVAPDHVCSICGDGTRAAGVRAHAPTLPCGHAFHASCARSLDAALSRKGYGASRRLRCPNCRRDHAYVAHASCVRIGGIQLIVPASWRALGWDLQHVLASFAVLQLKLPAVWLGHRSLIAPMNELLSRIVLRRIYAMRHHVVHRDRVTFDTEDADLCGFIRLLCAAT